MDLVATLLAGDSIPPGARRAVAAIAGGSALACAALARAVDEPPVPDVQAPEAAADRAPLERLCRNPYGG